MTLSLVLPSGFTGHTASAAAGFDTFEHVAMRGSSAARNQGAPANEVKELDQASRRDLQTAKKNGGDDAKKAIAVDQVLNDVAKDDNFKEGDGLRPPVYLLSFKPRLFKKGAVVLSFGNPALAANVVVVLRGWNSGTENFDELALNARRLHAEAALADPWTSTAVIAWQGYDAPGIDVIFDNAAKNGAEYLKRDLRQYRGWNSRANLGVIGHSYGSTVLGIALNSTKTAPLVNHATFIGSPGVGREADTVADLGLPANRVFVGAASRDSVTSELWSHLGQDPASVKFGAQRFKAEHVNRETNRKPGNHSLYFEKSSESLYSLAEIGVRSSVPAEMKARPRLRGNDPEKNRPPKHEDHPSVSHSDWGSANGSTGSITSHKQRHFFAIHGKAKQLVHWWREPGGAVRHDTWSRAAFQGQPAALAVGQTQHVFATTSVDTLFHYSWAPGRKVTSMELGKGLLGHLSTFRYRVGPAEQIHVFARAKDGSLRHWWRDSRNKWSNDEWRSPDQRGVRLAGRPLAYVWKREQHVFARGTDGSMLHWWWRPGDVLAPRFDRWSRPGTVTSDPVGFSTDQQQHVFWRNEAGALVHKYYNTRSVYDRNVPKFGQDTWLRNASPNLGAFVIGDRQLVTGTTPKAARPWIKEWSPRGGFKQYSLSSPSFEGSPSLSEWSKEIYISGFGPKKQPYSWSVSQGAKPWR